MEGCDERRPDVSIIFPFFNVSEWIDEALQSILDQTFKGSLELCAFNDGSLDDSERKFLAWTKSDALKNSKITVKYQSQFGQPKGVGFAKNKAVRSSRGEYLCFFDADDVMRPRRIQVQFDAASTRQDAIIGARFTRSPSSATKRYTRWANRLSHPQLIHQAYTANGPTVIMPTWFCHRKVYDKVGGFSEKGKGTPEDLIFFYSHLEKDGKIHRVDEDLLVYRYHPAATTFAILEPIIWSLRVAAFEKNVISKWKSFSIWNAGKQGRRLYRCLKEKNQNKVVCFCDVDENKINAGHYIYEESSANPKPTVPIIHFKDVKPPIAICCKQDMTNGALEANVASLNLVEGEHYFWFS